MKAGGPNHYSLALTYALLAAESMIMPMTPEQQDYLRKLFAF